MVDITIEFMGSIKVYKPTNITGGPHPFHEIQLGMNEDKKGILTNKHGIQPSKIGIEWG